MSGRLGDEQDGGGLKSAGKTAIMAVVVRDRAVWFTAGALRIPYTDACGGSPRCWILRGCAVVVIVANRCSRPWDVPDVYGI